MAQTPTTWQPYLTKLTQVAPAATLANGAGFLSAAYGSDTPNPGQSIWADLILITAYSVAPTAGSSISVYVLPSPDGTNYPYGGTAQIPDSNLWIQDFHVLAQTASQTDVIRRVELPPGLWKFLIWNATGQTMSSGWTMDIRPYSVAT